MQLPKLLAKENITISHGNYKTAWFDIKNRVLGLPMWEDKGKDVYDLLIGHEVGHALETPYEGWHDSPEKLEGCPRSYINVIEDARIERKIKNRYPGLVGPFARGYKKLYDDGFFGDGIEDWSQIKLIDKINLKAKVGNLLDVPMIPAEKVFYDRAMNTDDFSEVLELVKDILAYTKENQEELMQPPQFTDGDHQNESEGDQFDPTDNMGHDDLESDTQQPKGNNSEELNGKDEDTSEGSSSNDETESSSEEDVESPVFSSEPVHKGDVDQSITDTIFREMEKGLVEVPEDGQPIAAQDISKEFMDDIVINYNELAQDRNKRKSDVYSDTNENDWLIREYEASQARFKQGIKDIKKNVNFSVKEFEQRKAATQWQKASTAKTGVIDINKLWSYKTSDDIFLRTTKLADAKNHGMMLIVDYSGSMSSSIRYVLNQVLHTIMFCKAVNIPFEVYGFSTTNKKLYDSWRKFKDGDIELDDISMPMLCSSSLSKKDFEESIRHMWTRIDYDGWGSERFNSKYEDWGSTPLNQSLLVARHLIKKFRVKNNIEKMNLITFTDGDANSMRVMQDPKYAENKFNTYAYSSKIRVFVDGKYIEAKNRAQMTKAILENIKKQFQVNTIGFFMADDNHHWNNKLGQISHEKNYDWYDYKPESNKEYRKNKCVEVKNFGGYNNFYLVKGNKNLDTSADDFDIEDNASNGQIRNAFKKYSKSKKLNKVLMTKFGAAVA
ncbi:MAG: hypothetical protein CL845_06695 [Crocinitomicaceae bacterium]|nr:hypothetical protein [Crocinitomicaceae bacterium]